MWYHSHRKTTATSTGFTVVESFLTHFFVSPWGSCYFDSCTYNMVQVQEPWFKPLTLQYGGLNRTTAPPTDSQLPHIYVSQNRNTCFCSFILSLTERNSGYNSVYFKTHHWKCWKQISKLYTLWTLSAYSLASHICPEIFLTLLF